MTLFPRRASFLYTLLAGRCPRPGAGGSAGMTWRKAYPPRPGGRIEIVPSFSCRPASDKKKNRVRRFFIGPIAS